MDWLKKVDRVFDHPWMRGAAFVAFFNNAGDCYWQRDYRDATIWAALALLGGLVALKRYVLDPRKKKRLEVWTG